MKRSPGTTKTKSRSIKAIKREKLRQALLKLSPKQILYRKYRMERMSIFAAAVKAGYSVSYARGAATRKLEGLVKVSIIDELEMAGATNIRQARELTRIAFEAMETEKCEVYRDNGEGDITVEDAKTERPDNHARLKALDQIAKLKRQIVPASIAEMAGNNANYTRVTIVLEKESDGTKDNPAHRETKSRVALTDE